MQGIGDAGNVAGQVAVTHVYAPLCLRAFFACHQVAPDTSAHEDTPTLEIEPAFVIARAKIWGHFSLMRSHSSGNPPLSSSLAQVNSTTNNMIPPAPFTLTGRGLCERVCPTDCVTLPNDVIMHAANDAADGAAHICPARGARVSFPLAPNPCMLRGCRVCSFVNANVPVRAASNKQRARAPNFAARWRLRLAIFTAGKPRRRILSCRMEL